MAIAILTLSYSAISQNAWEVRINGLKLAQKEDFKARFPGKVSKGNSNTLVITQRQESRLASKLGIYNMKPLNLVSEYLSVLEELKYKVIASTSSIDAQSSYGMYVWTLSLERQAQPIDLRRCQVTV